MTSSGGSGATKIPTAVSFDEVYVPYSQLVAGDFKSGKTRYALSVTTFLETPVEKGGLGKKPEECLFVFLDMDPSHGVRKLVQTGMLTAEWKPRFKWIPATNMTQAEDAAKQWLPVLRDHQKKHGNETTWFVGDNMESPWKWCRNEHCINAYGMPEHELAGEKRRVGLEQGRPLPTLNPRDDYGAINGRHDDWINGIVNSGVNYLLLTPADTFEETDKKTNEKKTKLKIKGQGGNEGRVDDVLLLHRTEVEEKDAYGKAEQTTKYWLDLLGTRDIRVKPFKNLPNPSFLNLRLAMKKLGEGKKP